MSQDLTSVTFQGEAAVSKERLMITVGILGCSP